MVESRNTTVLEEAEDNLNNVFYTEEKLKFTFDRFFKMHISAHNKMIPVPDYVVPNPATRVRKLLSNIRMVGLNILLSHFIVWWNLEIPRSLKKQRTT